MDLQERVAVVTGAGRGIGRAVALALARAGAHVALFDLDEAALSAVAQEIRGLRRQAVTGVGSVTDLGQSRAFLDGVVSRFGRLDILVNNAGVSAVAPAETISEADWRRTIEVNLNAVFFWSQAAARPMIAQRSGVIINIASIYGRRPAPGRVAYCVTKAAVISLTEALAIEWAEYGLRVNAVAPGYTDTELFRRAQAEGKIPLERLLARVPLRRLASPEEIASAVVFLASPAARFITGHTLVVDGGWLPNGGW